MEGQMSRNSAYGNVPGASILNQDPVQLRDTLHQMHLDMEGLEKRIARLQKASRNMMKAYKVMNEASVAFQEALLPFSEGKDDSIIKSYTQTLGKVYESDMNLGERIPSVLLDALQAFIDNEVKPGLDLHAKMAKARDAYDSANVKASKSKRKDGAGGGLTGSSSGASGGSGGASSAGGGGGAKATPELDEKKREFEAANVRYVQKLIDFGAKREFELMDIFSNWMVCSLTHHKRAWKLLDELQPTIKRYKQKMLQERKGYKADEETRKVAVAESLAQNQKGSESDLQGYLTSKSGVSSRRQWWAVANGMLAQYRNYSDFAPSESYDLLLFTVKPAQDDPCAFALVSPNDNFTLQAPSPEERQQWVTAIMASISNQLNASQHADSGGAGGGGGATIMATSDPSHPLQQLRRGNDSFRACVDCGAKDPDWGAINLGIMFCINCSGIHRNLGVHISQVRSLTLDVDVWDEDLIRMMKGVGNETANSVWEACYTGSPPRPKVGCDMKQREAFIVAKYRDKAFVDALSPPLEEGFLEMLSHAGEEVPSVKDVIQYVVSGVDVNVRDDLGWSALAFLSQAPDSLVPLEYLMRNGCHPNCADEAGNTPLHVAVSNGWAKVAAALLRHGADPDAVNAGGRSCVQLAVAPDVAAVLAKVRGAASATRSPMPTAAVASSTKRTGIHLAIPSAPIGGNVGPTGDGAASPTRGRTWTSSKAPSDKAARLRATGGGAAGTVATVDARTDRLSGSALRAPAPAIATQAPLPTRGRAAGDGVPATSSGSPQSSPTLAAGASAAPSGRKGALSSSADTGAHRRNQSSAWVAAEADTTVSPRSTSDGLVATTASRSPRAAPSGAAPSAPKKQLPMPPSAPVVRAVSPPPGGPNDYEHPGSDGGGDGGDHNINYDDDDSGDVAIINVMSDDETLSSPRFVLPPYGVRGAAPKSVKPVPRPAPRGGNGQ